jgi:hypothetical protein
MSLCKIAHSADEHFAIGELIEGNAQGQIGTGRLSECLDAL